MIIRPFTPFFQQLDTLESLEDITFGRNFAGGFKTGMLAHDIYFPVFVYGLTQVPVTLGVPTTATFISAVIYTKKSAKCKFLSVGFNVSGQPDNDYFFAA